ncbi:FAD binding domain-containing protein [Xylariaceae sp. FL1272]|nr:FAD binding domain-containing protein [Xylariaceae sp. FL1272]
MIFARVMISIGSLLLASGGCSSLLTPNATIHSGTNKRWSEFGAPRPGAIVTVGGEDDVAKIVKFASQTNIPFLVQSGANGWADTFTLDSTGIIIDVSRLKTVTFNLDRTEVHFQAGVTNADMVEAAWQANALPTRSNFGGGLSRLQGIYGLNIDQLVSLKMVDLNGNTRIVNSETDRDLWWAMKGAGANFGIVTSATYKSRPIQREDNTAWTGAVIFDQSKIERVIEAINTLTLQPEMQVDVYFTRIDGQPAFVTFPFYLGSEEMGRQLFGPILEIGPLVDEAAVTPYSSWNAGGDVFCEPGSRKPSYSSALMTLDPTAWRTIWNTYVAFVTEYPQASNTTILAECYSNNMPVTSAHESAFPFRDTDCYAIAIPWYASAKLDDVANAFGRSIRSLWAASAGTPTPRAYINFAHGDEPLSEIYGASLTRLRQLKVKYDRERRFNQWFPLL